LTISTGASWPRASWKLGSSLVFPVKGLVSRKRPSAARKRSQSAHAAPR